MRGNAVAVVEKADFPAFVPRRLGLSLFADAGGFRKELKRQFTSADQILD